MSYEITGKVHSINETQSFPSGFQKREFVVLTEDKYPQEVKLEAVKADCDKLDAYKAGDPITVSFNIRGTAYNGKHFVNLQAWRFDRSNEAQAERKMHGSDAHNTAKANAYQPQPDEDGCDEIPF